MTQTYSPEFFRAHQPGARSSAQALAPLVGEWVRPASAIDLGCGLGTWLSVFQEHGVRDILGVDGPYVRREELEIPAGCFLAHDLTQPLALERGFELAVSLEVAEHLPAAAAQGLVATLTRLAPVVLFSAAIPGQGGRHHVNCQWPAYWAALFAAQGFVAIDGLRMRLWDDPRVDWWYQQNALLYVERGQLGRYPALQAEHARGAGRTPALVHPACLQAWIDWGLERDRACWDLVAAQPK